MRAVAVILVAPLFALGVASVAVGIVGGVVREPTQPNSVVWSQRVFTSQKNLETWLEARGGSYEMWAERHPSLASVFEKQTPTVTAVAVGAETHRRYSLLPPVVAGIALLVLLVVAVPRSRNRRRLRAPVRAPRQRRVRATPAFGVVRASASSVAQAGRSYSPQLQSFVRIGFESVADIHHALSSPQGRRTLRRIVLYAAYAIFAIALGASVAIYFP